MGRSSDQGCLIHSRTVGRVTIMEDTSSWRTRRGLVVTEVAPGETVDSVRVLTGAQLILGEGSRMSEQERRVIQRGLWFDEFEVGTIYEHRPGRTVTESDNVLFSALTMNTQALHLDAAWSATTEFGERLMNSLFTLSTLVGMSGPQLTQGTIVANLGFTEVDFPHPLRHGDTLYGETKVIDVRASRSRPGQGIVQLEHIGRNQNGVVVAKAVRKVLIQGRPVGEVDA